MDAQKLSPEAMQAKIREGLLAEFEAHAARKAAIDAVLVDLEAQALDAPNDPSLRHRIARAKLEQVKVCSDCGFHYPEKLTVKGAGCPACCPTPDA